MSQTSNHTHPESYKFQWNKTESLWTWEIVRASPKISTISDTSLEPAGGKQLWIWPMQPGLLTAGRTMPGWNASVDGAALDHGSLLVCTHCGVPSCAKSTAALNQKLGTGKLLRWTRLTTGEINFLKHKLLCPHVLSFTKTKTAKSKWIPTRVISKLFAY